MTPQPDTVATKVAENVAAQFTFRDFWLRLGCLVTALLGAIVTLGRLPIDVKEWAGFGLIAAGAIWTTKE